MGTYNPDYMSTSNLLRGLEFYLVFSADLNREA